MYGNVPTPQGNGSRTVVWASSSLQLNEGLEPDPVGGFGES